VKISPNDALAVIRLPESPAPPNASCRWYHKDFVASSSMVIVIVEKRSAQLDSSASVRYAVLLYSLSASTSGIALFVTGGKLQMASKNLKKSTRGPQMTEGWLNCHIVSGMFSDEVAVKVRHLLGTASSFLCPKRTLRVR